MKDLEDDLVNSLSEIEAICIAGIAGDQRTFALRNRVDNILVVARAALAEAEHCAAMRAMGFENNE